MLLRQCRLSDTEYECTVQGIHTHICLLLRKAVGGGCGEECGRHLKARAQSQSRNGTRVAAFSATFSLGLRPATAVVAIELLASVAHSKLEGLRAAVEVQVVALVCA